MLSNGEERFNYLFWNPIKSVWMEVPHIATDENIDELNDWFQAIQTDHPAFNALCDAMHRYMLGCGCGLSKYVFSARLRCGK